MHLSSILKFSCDQRSAKAFVKHQELCTAFKPFRPAGNTFLFIYAYTAVCCSSSPSRKNRLGSYRVWCFTVTLHRVHSSFSFAGNIKSARRTLVSRRCRGEMSSLAGTSLGAESLSTKLVPGAIAGSVHARAHLPQAPQVHRVV